MHNIGMAKILILNGPNLNLLGSRESAIYGKTTLEAINNRLQEVAAGLSHQVECHQSNAEHELVHFIQTAKNHTNFIIINPAAFTHTSVAIRDAFLAVDIPFIEVHLSNVFAREEFRHHSFLSDIAVGGVYGFGAYAYEMALNAADNYLQKV